jgi:hypothetical protein
LFPRSGLIETKSKGFAGPFGEPLHRGNRPWRAAPWQTTARSTAAPFGLKAIDAPVHSVADLEFVIAEEGWMPNGGLVGNADGFLNVHRAWIDLFRLAASYVNRMLRGAKPSKLPVQAPIKYELIRNILLSTHGTQLLGDHPLTFETCGFRDWI